jgi:hypothetical protein
MDKLKEAERMVNGEHVHFVRLNGENRIWFPVPGSRFPVNLPKLLSY